MAAALGLSGCVAAAIPMVAGGALVRSATDGRASSSNDEVPIPLAAASPAAEADTVPATPGTQSARSNRAIARFISHAAGQAGSATPPLSAMLREPEALDAKRTPCEQAEPAVLIDVDPADAIYAPGARLHPAPELAAGLAELRGKGVAIAWISGASAAFAGDLRMALVDSGLDPAGRDTLLLMRYPEDRKQTRREDLATTHCLIAIAGDERADFDELYDHLVNRDAAFPLERLIGEVWFLLPDLSADHDPAPSTLAAKDKPKS